MARHFTSPFPWQLPGDDLLDYYPMAYPHSADSPEPDLSTGSVHSQPLHLLLVEDNPGDAELIQEYLLASPYGSMEITWLETLEAAISYLAKHEVVLILLDPGLPDTYGFSGLEKLQELYPTTPVVVLTGRNDDALGLEAVRHGAQDYLIKDRIHKDNLYRVITYALERQKYHLELQQSENRYRELFNHMMDGFGTFEMLYDDDGRAENYRTLMVNPAFEIITGIPVEKIVGKKILEVLPELDRSWIETYDRVVKTGEPIRFTRYERELNKYFEVTAFRMGETEFGTVFQDVTDRVGMVEKLQQSRTMMARTESISRVGSWEFNFEDQSLRWSDECYRIHGLEPGSCLPTSDLLLKIYGKAQFEEVRGRVLAAIEDRRSMSTEVSPRLTHGQQQVCDLRIYVDEDMKGGLKRLYGSIQDISQRKRDEAERDRLVAAVEQAAEEVVITDTSGCIVYTNPAFTRGSGYSSSEANGQTMSLVKSGKHDAAYYDDLWKTITAGKIWKGTFINRRKDGTEYELDCTISPIRGQQGEIFSYVGVQHDVTQQKQLAHERAELEQQLAQSQKMEAVGRLAGGVAHDFNNMLQAILGYAEVAIESIEESNPLREDLLEIEKAAERSASLTRQLLAFARKQTINPRTVEFNETVGGMLQMLRRIIGEDIKLSWSPCHTAANITIDPAQIDQLLANLAVNSRDAIDGVGSINISSEVVDASQLPRELFTVTADHYIKLTFNDTGCGMSQETLEHLFEPFFTTKAQGEGTGLGMATVYGIVQQNQGHIDVKSELGKGTTFHIFLPQTMELTPAQISKRAEKPPKGTENLLLVEDEVALLRIARRHLCDLGYQVETAALPSEAFQVFEKQETPFDLVVTDVIMPEMNGLELINRLRESQPGLRVLFVSGYTADVIAKHGVLDPEVDFLQKPYSAVALSKKIREILDRPE